MSEIMRGVHCKFFRRAFFGGGVSKFHSVFMWFQNFRYAMLCYDEMQVKKYVKFQLCVSIQKNKVSSPCLNNTLFILLGMGAANDNSLSNALIPMGVDVNPFFLVGVGILSCPSFTREVECDGGEEEFTSRHSLDGKFLFIDPR